MSAPAAGTSSLPSPPESDLIITKGRCHALFAYDIGMGINLDVADRLITELTQREKLRHRRRAPKHFEYRPLPLRVMQSVEPKSFGAFATTPTVDLVLYDFGAVLVVYTIPISGPLDTLLPLSDVLYDNADLLADSRERVERLARGIEPAVARPLLADMVEDYLTFVVEKFQAPGSLSDSIACNQGLIAQILRSEPKPLAEQEIADALQCRLSFNPGDATLIDWNATILFDPDAEDVVAVLEYANVELLEMRFLDQKLDDALEQAYRALSQPKRPMWLRQRSDDSDTALVSQLQVDSALLFEGVNNSLKLLGDQYLARVYQMASQRFHLAEWDASILRKLGTLDSIYGKMNDRTAAIRMEVLEWIIIVLIAVSIVLPFVPGLPKH